MKTTIRKSVCKIATCAIFTLLFLAIYSTEVKGMNAPTTYSSMTAVQSETSDVYTGTTDAQLLDLSITTDPLSTPGEDDLVINKVRQICLNGGSALSSLEIIRHSA